MNRYGYSLSIEEDAIAVVPTGGPLYLGMRMTLGPLQLTIRQLHKVIPNPEWEVPEHSQPDIEIHIIPYGLGTIQIEDTEFEASSGELYVTGPYVRHRQKADPHNPMGEYCLSLDISANPEAVPADPVQDEMADLAHVFTQTLPYAVKDAYRAKELFDDIFAEAERGDRGYRMRIQLLIGELLIGVYRALKRNEEGRYPYALTDRNERSRRLALITDFITRRYMDNVTVHELAGALFLSEKQTNRILKREFNQTFKDYLSYHRFMAAKKLVLGTTLTTNEIAYRCGFTDEQHLYKIFRKFNCPAPSKLRRMEQSQPISSPLR